MKKEKIKDEELIRQLQQGDEAAFNQLYERYVKLVYFIAYKMCKNDADSKDVVQETFIEVKRAIHSLQNPSVFKFWLNRITISKCKNLFRKNKYANMDDENAYVMTNTIEERSYLIPEKAMHFQSDHEVLSSFIDQLPISQKEVLILFYLEQFSIDEISNIMDIPSGTVKSRLSYGRASLKELITKYEDRNGIRLSFHSLGEAIGACLIGEYAKIKVPSILLGGSALGIGSGVHSTFFSMFQSVVTTGLAKVGIIATLVVGGSGAVFVAYKANVAKTSPESIVQTAIDVEEERIPFPTVHVMNKDIDTAKSAYFNIKLWACCEEEMKNLSTEQMQDIHSVYSALKEVKSPYYDALVNEGWALSFENNYSK